MQDRLLPSFLARTFAIVLPPAIGQGLRWLMPTGPGRVGMTWLVAVQVLDTIGRGPSGPAPPTA